MPPYRANRGRASTGSTGKDRPIDYSSVIDAAVGGAHSLIQQAYLRNEKKKGDARQASQDAIAAEDRSMAIEDRARTQRIQDEDRAHAQSIEVAKLKAEGITPKNEVTSQAKVDLPAVASSRIQGAYGQTIAPPPAGQKPAFSGFELDRSLDFDHRTTAAFMGEQDRHSRDLGEKREDDILDHERALELQDRRNLDSGGAINGGGTSRAAASAKALEAQRKLRAVESQIDDTRTDQTRLEKERPDRPSTYDLEDAAQGDSTLAVKAYARDMKGFEPRSRQLQARADSLGGVRDSLAAEVQGKGLQKPSSSVSPAQPAPAKPPAAKPAPKPAPVRGTPTPAAPKGDPSDSLLLALDRQHKGDVNKIKADLRARGFRIE